jgi:hypothetical protein
MEYIVNSGHYIMKSLSFIQLTWYCINQSSQWGYGGLNKTYIHNFHEETSWKANTTKLYLMDTDEMDGTGSGSCPMVDFGISGVEHSGWATSISQSMVPISWTEAVRETLS